jgi:hypothetical protein
LARSRLRRTSDERRSNGFHWHWGCRWV